MEIILLTQFQICILDKVGEEIWRSRVGNPYVTQSLSGLLPLNLEIYSVSVIEMSGNKTKEIRVC